MNGYVISEDNWFMKTAAHGAVWVFFFLSGYFNIKGFLGAKPTYRIDLQGISRFYIKKFFKILLPVWCFYLIALTISEPSFLVVYPETIWHLLTFTYSGEPGCTSIAATWYVSSLAWLYFFTPLIALVCRKLDKQGIRIRLFATAIIVAMLGFALRFILLLTGADWTQGVFVPFYCNLDIYICGAIAYIIGKRFRLPFAAGISYAASFVVYSLLLIIHSRIYYLGDIDGKYIIIHGYLMPTVYILIMTIVCLLIRSAGYHYLPVSFSCIKRNPFRLIDAFSAISFQFYLVHSMVLFHMSSIITVTDGAEYNRRLLMAGFVLSVPLAILFKKATAFKIPGGSSSKNEAGQTRKEEAVSGDIYGSAT